MNLHPLAKALIYFVLFVFCFFPVVDAPTALFLGFLASLLLGNPFREFIGKTASVFLKISIIGLGFGMDFMEAVDAGKTGLLLTVATIAFVLLAGWLLGKLFKLNSKTSYLISAGTAICGGSAIAAIAPVIKANSKQMSVALGAVFLLNALALFIFPLIGRIMDMSQYQFGLWSAIAIHDTSSVVGAASKYGHEALEIATTIKLGRALWIIPLSLITAWFYRRNGNRLKIPYFIFLFILAMLLSSFLTGFQAEFMQIAYLAKRSLIATLFLIGAGLSLKTIRSVGLKTFFQAGFLWVLVSFISLFLILGYY